MKLKRTLALILALVLAFALVACGGPKEPAGSSSAPSSGAPAPVTPNPDGSPVSESKKMTIGLLGNMFTNSFEKGEKVFIDTVLAPAFPNVSFIYSESYKTIEGQREQIESLIMQGCEAIIASVVYDSTSALEICAANGVYFTTTWSAPAPSQSSTWSGEMLDYFLGYAAVTPEEEVESLKKIVSVVKASGADELVCVYGKPGYVTDSCDALRLQGAKEALGDKYSDDRFFKVDFSDVAATLALGGDMLSLNPTAIISTYPGLASMCTKEILSSGRADQMYVATIGALDSLHVESMRSGAIDYNMAHLGETVAGAFVLVYNALNDGVIWRNDDGSFVVCNQPGVEIDSLETLDAYLVYCGDNPTKPFFPIETIKSCLAQYNPGATAADWQNIFGDLTLEGAAARNG